MVSTGTDLGPKGCQLHGFEKYYAEALVPYERELKALQLRPNYY